MKAKAKLRAEAAQSVGRRCVDAASSVIALAAVAVPSLLSSATSAATHKGIRIQ